MHYKGNQASLWIQAHIPSEDSPVVTQRGATARPSVFSERKRTQSNQINRSRVSGKVLSREKSLRLL
ncbi:hypothetical protein ANANG_G00192560 [Anguilla anguilla]|uniref:Uncharacterized protein n=1 Tax=Anguilla anguilla TaxID=7936 RepID=A0A9D3RVB8_ANGAN|nr:hypothetical protein ANANG_G00192560 [Anguilla anguilla]